MPLYLRMVWNKRKGYSLRRWFGRSLNRKFNLTMVSGLLVISLVFLYVFLGAYRQQLEQERARASTEVNHLLQTSLENAMLKRDLEGLRGIIDRLGNQPGIERVMILNPAGEVRFASDPGDLGRHFIPVCEGCDTQIMPTKEFTRFVVDSKGEEVLRSVNPVHNKQPCTKCHGPIRGHPINGVLLVDSQMAAIRDKAWSTALTLAGSGGIVVLLTMLGGWWFMGRFVLSPVDTLERTSRFLSEGQIQARVTVKGDDELARLGRVFNEMADNLQRSLQIIQEKEAFLQGLIDAIPDGIRVIDSDFSIVKANSSYCTQLGQELEKVALLKCFESSHNRSKACAPTMLTCPVHEIGRSKASVKTIQQHQRKDGSSFHVEVFAAPMWIEVEGERREYIVESIRDMEKEIDYSQEQRLAAMGQLAAGVAHEIRNPLSSIRFALQSTLRETEGKRVDLTKVSRYLRRVDDEIDKCIDVTERLLKLSEPAVGRPQLISLNVAIEETISLLASNAMEHDILIETLLLPSEVRVLGAESEVRTLVFNLVENAFHAMPSGGRLHVVTQAGGGEARMVFEDTGVGISAENYPYIFDPFFSSRADKTKGIGLGLSICKSIVSRYNGRIEVESRMGEGSRFIVVLPDADAGHQ